MSTELVTITIDGKEVQVPKGMLLVEAAKLAENDIPVFCYHPKLEPAGVCRMCLVEVEGQRKPVTACTMPVSDGMVVNTKSDLVQSLQRGVLEFLLLNHPLDCPVCDKGGECPLQDNTFKFGPGTSRSLDPKVRKNKAVDLGNFIVLDEERCILCRRCTRFDHEITGEDHLVVGERAHEAMITTADGKPFNSYFSGNTIELCPVGALTSDLYRFKARPWDISRAASVCSGCSVGCNVSLDFRFGELTRIVDRDNPDTDAGWLCDRGRFNYKYVNGDNRVKEPMVRKDGQLTPVSWDEAYAEIARQVRNIEKEHGGASIGAVGGGRLTNEEAYLFQKLVRVGFDSPNVDWRTGEQYVSSNSEFAGRMTDIDEADAVLLVDVLLAERAPVADLRVRRVAENGGTTVAAVGPAMPQYRPEIHEFPAVGAEVANTLAGEALFKLVDGKERVVVLWSGREPAVGAAVTQLLRKLKSAGSDVKLLIPGEQSNAWGAESMGVRPDRLPGFKDISDERARAEVEQSWQTKLPADAGLNTREMLHEAVSGGLQALYLAGANLLTTFPDRNLVEEALEAVPFLIVQDLFLTEVAQKADVLLPAASFPAKTGHYTTMDGNVQRVDRSMDNEFETRPDGTIFGEIGDALGVRLAGTRKELEWEIQHLSGWNAQDHSIAAAPEEMTLVSPKGSPKAAPSKRSEPRANELTLVAVERLFAGGGTSYFDEGIRRARPAASAAVHPQDAQRLQVGEGDAVTLQDGRGELTLSILIDERVIPGTVQVPKGLVEAPVNVFGSTPQANVSLMKPVAEEVG